MRSICKRERELLSFPDLPPAEREDLADHAARCPACSKRLEEVRGLAQILAGESHPLPASVLTAARSIPDGRTVGTMSLPRVSVASVVAAATVLLAASLLLTGRLAPAPAPSPSPCRVRAPTPAPSVGPTAARTPVKAPAPATSMREQVILALTHPSPASARFLDDEGTSVLVILTRIADGRDPVAARAAIARLGALHRIEALPALSRAVARKGRRKAAIRALAEIGDESSVPVIEPFLDDPALGRDAREALARIGGDRAAAALARAIPRRTKPRAAIPLVAALGRTGGLTATRDLLYLLDEKPLAPAAYAALAANRDRLIPFLLQLVRTRNRVTAHRALRAIAFLAPPEAVRTLKRLLADRSLRGAAARALIRIDTPAAGEALLSRPLTADVRDAFRDAGPGITRWLVARLNGGGIVATLDAVDLLGRTGNPRAVSALLPLGPHRALGPSVVRALARIGGPHAVRALAQLTRQDWLRRQVVAALGETGDPTAVPVLTGLARKEPALKGAVLSALARTNTRAAVEAILRLADRNTATRLLATLSPRVVLPALDALRPEEIEGPARYAVEDLVRRTRRPLTFSRIH